MGNTLMPGTEFVIHNAEFAHKSSRFLHRVAVRLAEWATKLERRAISIDFGHGVLASLFDPQMMPAGQMNLLGNHESQYVVDNATGVDLAKTAKDMTRIPALRDALLRGYTKKPRAPREIERSIKLAEKIALKSEVGSDESQEAV